MDNNNFPDVMRPGQTGNPGQLMTPDQQEQAKAIIQKLAGVVKNIGASGALGGGAPQHKPILKALEELGIPLKTRDIQLDDNDETTVCVVIPLQELISKEYEYLTGVNVESVNKNGTTGNNNQSGEVKDV